MINFIFLQIQDPWTLNLVPSWFPEYVTFSLSSDTMINSPKTLRCWEKSLPGSYIIRTIIFVRNYFRERMRCTWILNETSKDAIPRYEHFWNDMTLLLDFTCINRCGDLWVCDLPCSPYYGMAFHLFHVLLARLPMVLTCPCNFTHRSAHYAFNSITVV